MKRFRLGGRELRRARRHRADWHGSYTLPAHPTMGSGQCRVLDVSTFGAGLELYGPCPRQGVDEELLVRLDPSQDRTGGCELRGRVRNVAGTKFGFVRVGVEFARLSDDERTFLRSLTERQPVEI